MNLNLYHVVIFLIYYSFITKNLKLINLDISKKFYKLKIKFYIPHPNTYF